MTKIQKALDVLNDHVTSGCELWDVIGRIARANGVTEKSLLAAYDKQFENSDVPELSKRFYLKGGW